MRKNYFLLVLALILSSIWNGASAAVGDVYEKGALKTSFKTGDKFALVNDDQTHWSPSGAFLQLSGMKREAILNENCVIEITATGENGPLNKRPTFYLKQVSVNKYMGKDGAMVDLVDAVAYEILINSESLDAKFNYPSGDDKEVVEGMGSKLTRCATADENSVAFGLLQAEEEGRKFATFLAAYGGWSGRYTDTNAWHAYEVSVSKDYYVALENLVGYYTDNLKLNYPTSATSSPGFFKSEAALRYENALAAANDALFNDVDDEPTLIGLAAELEAAKLNADTSYYPMKEGYFRFRSAYPGYLSTQNVEMAMYINANNDLLNWKAIDVKDAYFIFKVTKNADGKNWDVQNLGTDGYVSTSGGATTSKPSTAQVFGSIGVGQWHINNVGAGPYHTNNHGNGSGKGSNIVNYAGDRNTASSWFVDEVSDMTLIDSLTNAMVQVKLNLRMKNLVKEAKTLYDKGWTINKLITDVSQLYSNAPQTNEGKIDFLIDGITTATDASNYFHSRWSGEAVNEYHYLQVELKKPISEFQLYTYSRNNRIRPDSIVISASNDKNDWTEITRLPNKVDTLPYTAQQMELNSSLMQLGANYSHVRFTVIATSYDGNRHVGVKDGTAAGTVFSSYPYFTYSEFQMYPKNKIDPSSQNNYLSSASGLKAAIEVADTIKVAATEAQIATLQAAIDAYSAEVVDTTVLTEAIKAAVTLSESAVVGEEIGQSNVDGVAALVAAIEKAKSVALILPNGQLISREALDAAVAELKTAVDTYSASVISVVPDVWYYILNRMKPAETDNRNDAGIQAINGGLKWGGAGDFNKRDDASYIWRFVAMGDTAYAVQNLATGQYMAAIAESGVQVKLTPTPTPYRVKYIGATQFSLVPVLEKDALPLHAQAAGAAVVGWSDGANSASAWTFENAVPSEVVSRAIDMNGIAVVTLPYEYKPEDLYGVSLKDGSDFELAIYSLAGKKTESGVTVGIYLHQYEAGATIEPGTPVVMISGDHEAFDETALLGEIRFDLSNIGGLIDSNINLTSTPLSVNGLVGAFNSVTLTRDGLGLLELGKLRVLNASQGEGCGYMSGYIDESQIANLEGVSQDLYIPVGEGNPLNIDGVTGNKDGKTGKIYTVGGVYAGSTATGLKPGLYIINGKVVRL